LGASLAGPASSVVVATDRRDHCARLAGSKGVGMVLSDGFTDGCLLVLVF
jgi:hypothetical protein